MLRILFLVLIIMSSVAFAQTQEKKEAYKFFEYEKTRDSLLREKIRSFCAEKDKVRGAGDIIIYGTPKEIAKREKQILDNFPMHCARVTFIRAGDQGRPTTELWIVPPGAERPKP